MRQATLAVLVLLGGCSPAPDPFIGTFTQTMTGTNRQISPDSDSSSEFDFGTIAVTPNALTSGYLLSVVHGSTNKCTLDGTLSLDSAEPEIALSPSQKCSLTGASEKRTMTLGSGKAVLTLHPASRLADQLTLTLSYSYVGTRYLFNVSTSGSGERSYTGSRR